MNPSRLFRVLGLGAVLTLAACGSDGGSLVASESLDPDDVASAEVEGTTVRLITHESFLLSDGIFDEFTDATGITVEVLAAGDAGEVVARSILTAGDPEGDVLFGIDNTFLQRGLDADLFVPYASPELDAVPDSLELDEQHRVTPIDVGDVCVNYWSDALPGDAPATLEDLATPANAASFVTPHAESSSPGFAFLLATIAHFGEDGWEDYWQSLVDGGVTITSGWSEAYYGDFVAGGGDKSLVTSYATSPVAEVVFAEEPMDQPPTGVMTGSCFRQIEFAGILAGTEHPEASALLIDHLLSPTVQEDIPLNMFVTPVRDDITLPAEFVEFGVTIDEPFELSPTEIEANRSDWTQRWVDIVAS